MSPRPRAACLRWAIVLAALASDPAQAQEAAPTAADSGSRRVVLRRPSPGAAPSPGLAGWGWTLAGLALALGALGGAVIASRRAAVAGPLNPGSLRVIGRSALGPKHVAYLVRAGDQVFLVGTGPAGPPALLGTLPTHPIDETTPGGGSE